MNPRTAAEALEGVVLNDSEDDRSYFALGICYEQMGEYDKALAAYQRAHELSNVLEYEDGWKRIKAKMANQ